MDLVFNELSFLPLTENDTNVKNSFIDMIKLYALVSEKYGYRHIVFPSNIGQLQVSKDKSFTDWIGSIPHSGDRNKILSFIKRPFGQDLLEERIIELNKYYYNNPEAGIIEEYCLGLAISYLTDRISISLATNSCWCFKEILFKEIIDDDLTTKDVVANNVSLDVHLKDVNIKTFLLEGGQLQLIEDKTEPTKKPSSFRDDHGKNKLKLFSKLIFRSPYVSSVINSLPFNPTDTNLVRKTYEDGKIELVLHWEDAGYGMIIQTTGRNIKETTAIAEIIKKQFDR